MAGTFKHSRHFKILPKSLLLLFFLNDFDSFFGQASHFGNWILSFYLKPISSIIQITASVLQNFKREKKIRWLLLNYSHVVKQLNKLYTSSGLLSDLYLIDFLRKSIKIYFP